jgi:hypothetical protein
MFGEFYYELKLSYVLSATDFNGQELWEDRRHVGFDGGGTRRPGSYQVVVLGIWGRRAQ